MEISYSIKDSAGTPRSVEINEPDKCPLCGHAIKPQILASSLYKVPGHGQSSVAFLFLCKACYSSFMFQSALNPYGGGYTQSGAPVIGPNKFIPVIFSTSITDLSPRFIEIYNQAFAAEQYRLDHIAGMGYRKALEFLVKDFIISTDPGKEEDVKKTLLGPCINKFIDNERIKTLANVSTWLGNDETHYVRKHEEYNVNDLKKFIQALVSYVESEIILREALAVSPK